MTYSVGRTIWFTGLSGSGKSTLSSMLKAVLESRGVPVALMDGDLLREGLNRDLGFSAVDRAENIRRAGEVAKVLCDEGHTVLAAFITPLESLRNAVRNIFEPGRFVEIFLDCPLAVCEGRDPKGLYFRARKGEIPEFTGVSSPFENPVCSELAVPTGDQTSDESLHYVLRFLEAQFPDLRSHRPRMAFKKIRKPKLAVIGLDSAPPFLVFDEFRGHMPNLSALMAHGAWGCLRSTDPPVTVPAWTCMTTGKDPGELGLYGFRNRLRCDYAEMVTVNSTHVAAARVWNYLEEAGCQSILLGIPQTYPAQPHNGITVSDFLAPGLDSNFTYPQNLVCDLHRVSCGEYMPDVKDFRKRGKDALLRDLHTMVERRFRVASHLLIHHPWDFFMMVEIAPDRLHHGFWRFCRSDHSLFEPDNRYENVLREFYGMLDARVGSLLALMDDDTTVMVVSDHGARNMAGGVCINEWLMKNGYLCLLTDPCAETPVSPDMIDWSRTSVWSEGGYYARIFINLQGREPQGIVRSENYESLRTELAKKLACIRDKDGSPMRNQVLRPEEVYRSVANVAPDLMVYFDGLSRRSIGTVGGGNIHVNANDTGPDDANHDPEGVFIFTRLSDLRRGISGRGRIEGVSCLDITPTVLHEFGLTVPPHMGGRIINWDGDSLAGASNTNAKLPASRNTSSCGDVAAKGYSAEEEEIIKKRLADLGYI
jgi:adenylyl-sulfate kinase